MLNAATVPVRINLAIYESAQFHEARNRLGKLRSIQNKIKHNNFIKLHGNLSGIHFIVRDVSLHSCRINSIS